MLLREPGQEVPGCEGVDETSTNYCIRDSTAKSANSDPANGAEVLSVNVVSADQKVESTATAAEKEEEDSSAVSSTMALSAGLASMVAVLSLF